MNIKQNGYHVSGAAQVVEYFVEHRPSCETLHKFIFDRWAPKDAVIILAIVRQEIEQDRQTYACICGCGCRQRHSHPTSSYCSDCGVGDCP